MTMLLERGKAFCRCDVCGAESPEGDNPVSVQRVAINFCGWRVFKLNEKWQHSCPECLIKWREW